MIVPTPYILIYLNSNPLSLLVSNEARNTPGSA